MPILPWKLRCLKRAKTRSSPLPAGNPVRRAKSCYCHAARNVSEKCTGVQNAASAIVAGTCKVLGERPLGIGERRWNSVVLGDFVAFENERHLEYLAHGSRPQSRCLELRGSQG